MQDARRRKPSRREAFHPIPGETLTLASTPERPEPDSSALTVEGTDGPAIAGHGVVSEMSSHHAGQPSPLFRDGQMPTSHKLLFDLLEFRPQPPLHRVAPEPKNSVPGLPTNVILLANPASEPGL